MSSKILSLIKPSNKIIKTSIIREGGYNIINFTGKNFYFILNDKKYLFFSIVTEENSPQLLFEKSDQGLITEVKFLGVINLPQPVENNIYVVSPDVCIAVGNARNDLAHCFSYYTDSLGKKEYTDLIRFS